MKGADNADKRRVCLHAAGRYCFDWAWRHKVAGLDAGFDMSRQAERQGEGGMFPERVGVQVMAEGEGFGEGDTGGSAEELDSALANADEGSDAEDADEERRATALAKMAQLPESKEEIEIVSRAQ